MRCNFCLYPSLWYKHLYSQSLQYLNGISLKSETFPFRHKKSFNTKVIYILLFLIRSSADIRVHSFLSNSLSEAITTWQVSVFGIILVRMREDAGQNNCEYWHFFTQCMLFQNFSAHNNVICFSRFWNDFWTDFW